MSPDAIGGVASSSPQVPPADLSSRTVTMLVILTLVISFLGAWMNLHQASLLGASVADDGVASSNAQVSFTIDPPEHETTTAVVGFAIAPPAG